MWRKFLVDSCPRVGSRWTDGSLAVLALKELPAEKMLECSDWGRILALTQMYEFYAEASHPGVQSWGLQVGSTCYTWELGGWELLSDAQHRSHPHLLSSCPELNPPPSGRAYARAGPGLAFSIPSSAPQREQWRVLSCPAVLSVDMGKPLMCHVICSLMH